VNPDPKPKTYEDPKYIAWIKTLGCFYCGKPSEPHHIRRQVWGAGTGKKPHDYVAVPRCRDHHDPKYEDNVEVEIITLLIAYFGKE